MLRDAHEVAIMAHAAQQRLRAADRSATGIAEIVMDFDLVDAVRGRRVVELGPGHYEFSELARLAGASEVVALDRDDPVAELGRYRGFVAVQGDLQRIGQLTADLEPCDGLFAKGAINAFWFWRDDTAHLEWIAELASLIREDGWAWIAPWNVPPAADGLSQERIDAVLETQLRGFKAAGMRALTLTAAQAARYGMDDARLVFVRNVAQRSSASPAVATASPADAHAPLPAEYHTGLIDLLSANPEVFNVITYRDLPWEDDYDYLNSYPEEWARWRAWAAEHDEDRIHVMLQHDVDDAVPTNLWHVRYEMAARVPTNIMVFARAHARGTLAREGRVEVVPYPLDVPMLLDAERNRGFVIGYHTNAVEQSLWDLDAAAERFVADVAALRQTFDIQFFSPHGGVRGGEGLNNYSIELPEEVTRDVRWVHNHHAVRFHGRYSDGGLVTKTSTIPPPDRDLREFVRTFKPGRRYHILTHPQYYGTVPVRNEWLDSQAPWARTIMDEYERGEREFWRDVWPEELGSAPRWEARARR